ncbi:hypothetical protein CI610_01549 [invertebrate metagenome]|uniref:Ion channel protein Tsx n=1 Tax=invertebrate metagenome TaxID=1711999 RepID=A0A2H9T8E2_9ZZZZ
MKYLRSLSLCSVVAAASLASCFVSSASADYQYGFGNVSINYLDWSQGTESRTHETKKDFTYLELEGGAGFSWGEIYGFADLENPTKSNEEDNGNGRRVAMKGTIRYYLGNTGFNLYGHVYDLSSNGFDEQNRLLGVGYNFEKNNFFFKPFLTVNNTNKHGFGDFSGFNGYVAGWVLGYSFKIADQNMMVTNWHEYEFDRDKEYSDGEKNGVNGAVALWWNATQHITAGVQYRYAYNKLGANCNQNAMIYSLKYNF